MTSERRLPPMGGLAVMAWRLACDRAYRDPDALRTHRLFRPAPEDLIVAIRCDSATGHYFQIIDCVTHGHRWRAEKEFNSCSRCHAVKANRDFKPGEFQRGY